MVSRLPSFAKYGRPLSKTLLEKTGLVNAALYNPVTLDTATHGTTRPQLHVDCPFNRQSLYLYIGFCFENRKNSGLTPGQNDDPVTRTWKMTRMTHWPGDPMTQFHVWLAFHKIITPAYLGYFTVLDRSLFIIPKFIPYFMVPVIQWRYHWRHRPWRMFAGGPEIIVTPLIRAARGPTNEGVQQKWKTTITTRFPRKWGCFRNVNQRLCHRRFWS